MGIDEVYSKKFSLHILKKLTKNVKCVVHRANMWKPSMNILVPYQRDI